MRNTKKTVRRTAVVGGTVAALIGGGVAFAYWTTSGAGEGTATNASNNGTVTLHASWAANSLYPGGSQPVSFTADNTGASNLYVGTIKLVGVSVDDQHSACDTKDFTMSEVAEKEMVPAGETAHSLPTTGTLVFANSANDQSACKGATITLSLTSN